MTVAAFKSSPAAADVTLRIGRPCVTVAGGRDEHRRVRTEEQQRREVDDEGRRHRRPVARGRLRREGRGQNRCQDQAAEFDGPSGLGPARVAKQRSCAGRDGRKQDGILYDDSLLVEKQGRSHLCACYRNYRLNSVFRENSSEHAMGRERSVSAHGSVRKVRR